MTYSVWPCLPWRTSTELLLNVIMFPPSFNIYKQQGSKETFSASSLFPKSACTKYDQSSMQTAFQK